MKVTPLISATRVIRCGNDLNWFTPLAMDSCAQPISLAARMAAMPFCRLGGFSSALPVRS
jgi:hypothetical protein